MEKPHSSLKGKILMFIPRAASAAVTFKSPPISPRKPPAGSLARPTSGSVIPRDARRRLKNGSFDAQEPASPIVSCVGQVKKSKKKKAAGMAMTTRAPSKAPDRPKEPKKKDPHMMILKLFKGKKLPGEKSHHEDALRGGGENENPVPSLGHLKQFSSSRVVLANFDWMAHCGTAVAPDNFLEHGHEEDAIGEEEREERSARVPHSAPIEVMRSSGNGEKISLQPQKEINLWKRRTGICPPTTLRL